MTTSSNTQQAIPAPLNYRGFPKSICTSVNHVVCHGIPSEKKLRNGDSVNIDITVIKDGLHGDTSRMFHVGKPNVQAQRTAHSVTMTQCGKASGWCPPRRTTRRHRPRDSEIAPKRSTARSCANTAATALAGSFTKIRRFCITAGRIPALKSYRRHGVHDRTDGQCRQAARQTAAGRLDGRYQGPFSVGAVGAHRADHRGRVMRC